MSGITRTASSAPNIRHAKAWLEGTAHKLGRWAELAPDAQMASAMSDEAATIRDVAERAPLPVEKGAIVVMQASAIAAYHEAVQLVSHAQVWANNLQGWDFDGHDDQQTTLELNRRREQAAVMELSLHRSLAHLMTVAQDYDGPCVVSRDGEGSFFWHHTQSGYHGGIVFHASYAEKGTERLPVGTWSIHT